MKETFGQRLSRLRKQSGLTQEELAEKFGISGQAVSKWENDASMPDISILPDLSDVLRVSLNELLGKEENKARIVPVGERKDTNDLILKVRANLADGDKVTVAHCVPPPRHPCIHQRQTRTAMKPTSAIPAMMNMKMPQISGSEALQKVDFEEIIRLVDQGMVGELVTVESPDGDNVRVFVE